MWLPGLVETVEVTELQGTPMEAQKTEFYRTQAIKSYVIPKLQDTLVRLDRKTRKDVTVIGLYTCPS